LFGLIFSSEDGGYVPSETLTSPLAIWRYIKDSTLYNCRRQDFKMFINFTIPFQIETRTKITGFKKTF
jgi:hypothetical protein